MHRGPDTPAGADRISASLRPYLPRVVAEWATADPSSVHRRVEGTLVSADISGFTALSEQLAGIGREGAEEVVAVVNRCFDGMITDVEQLGGDVLKFGGDALFVLFTGPGHTSRAVAACALLQQRMQEPVESRGGEVELSMSIGVHRGEVDLFVLHGGHREFVVTGPAASATLRAESAADRGEVLLTEEAAQALDPGWFHTHTSDGATSGFRLLAAPLDVVAADAERVGTGASLLQPGRAPDPAGTDLRGWVPASLVPTMSAATPFGEIRPVATTFIAFDGIEQTLRDRGPQEVARQLSALAGAVSLASREYGVHWLDTDVGKDGGKVHLTAGAPTTVGDDAGAMLRTVRAVLDTCPAPRLRAGVNLGHVFTGDVGSATRRTFAAMGDSVNLAARLSGRADAGQLVATRHTLGASRARFVSVDLEPFTVKGKLEPIEAAAVGAPQLEGGRAGRGTRGRDREPTFVGRAGDVDALTSVIKRVLEDRRPRSVLVVAGHGAGKSRLLDRVLSQRPDLRVLTARGDLYEASTPYHPFRGLLRDLLGIAADADPRTAGRQLVATIERVVPELRAWVPLLAVPVGAEVAPTPEVDRIAMSFRRLRLQAAVVDLLTALLDEPTAFVVDDLQWFDDGSRNLLLELVRGGHDRRWTTFVASHEVDEDLEREPDVTVHHLEGLDPAAATLLAREVVGEAAVTDRGIQRIVERSSGEPLFVIELASFAMHGGDPERLPATVEEAVTSGIDRLDPEHRALLREAAVLGQSVDLDLLATVLAQPEVRTAVCWEPLRGFVRHEGGTVAFREHVTGEVAYAGLAFARRRVLHAEVAAELARRHEAGAAVGAEELARHHHRGELHQGAWQWSVAAGAAAGAAYAPVEAVDLYGQALAAAEHLPALAVEDVLRVAEARGDAAEVGGRYEIAREAYTLAMGLSEGEATGRMSEKVADTYERAGDQAERSGQYADARRNYADAMVRRGEQVLHRARISRKIGEIDERQGDYDGALERNRAALAWLEGLDLPAADQARAGLHTLDAGVLFRKGAPADALARADEAIETARRAGSAPALARAQYLRGLARSTLGEDGSDDLRAALTTFEEAGDLDGQAKVHNNLGYAAHFAGDWDAAVEHYEASRRARVQVGDLVGEAMQANNVGEVLCDRGQLDAAGEALNTALRTFAAARYSLEPMVRSNVGRLEMRRGDLARAEQLLRSALADIEALGAEYYVADTRLRLAEVALHAGDVELAREELAQVPGDPTPTGIEQCTMESTRRRLHGLAHELDGELGRAAEVLEEAVEVAEALGEGWLVLQALHDLARVRVASGGGVEDLGGRIDRVVSSLGVVAVPVFPTPRPPEPESEPDVVDVPEPPLAVRSVDPSTPGADVGDSALHLEVALAPAGGADEVSTLVEALAVGRLVVGPSARTVEGPVVDVLRLAVRLVGATANDPLGARLRLAVGRSDLVAYASPAEVVLAPELVGTARAIGIEVHARPDLPRGAGVVRLG